MGAMVIALLAFLFMARGQVRACLMIVVLIGVSMARGFAAGEIFEYTPMPPLARPSILTYIQRGTIATRSHRLPSPLRGEARKDERHPRVSRRAASPPRRLTLLPHPFPPSNLNTRMPRIEPPTPMPMSTRQGVSIGAGE